MFECRGGNIDNALHINTMCMYVCIYVRAAHTVAVPQGAQYIVCTYICHYITLHTLIYMYIYSTRLDYHNSITNKRKNGPLSSYSNSTDSNGCVHVVINKVIKHLRMCMFA